jgi:hypothetical protein
MDMNQFRKSLAKRQKLSEAPEIDGKVNAVVWHGPYSGEATLMVHQKHDKGQHGVDQACFALLKAHLGPPLQALTKLKIEDTPVRTAEGNYWLVKVEFKTKQ